MHHVVLFRLPLVRIEKLPDAGGNVALISTIVCEVSFSYYANRPRAAVTAGASMSAATQSPVASRRFASPTLRALAGRRLTELFGLLLCLLGITLLLALATYNPRDPSFDTATTLAPTNLAGTPGALVADLLLQGFGLTSMLPGFALLAWAWRIAWHGSLGRLTLRLGSLILAMPLLSLSLAAVPVMLPDLSRHLTTFANPANFGGAIGGSLASNLFGLTKSPIGMAGAWFVATSLGIAGTLVCLGLTVGEWRAAGRSARTAARRSFEQRHRVTHFVGRLSEALPSLGRPMDEEDEVAPAPLRALASHTPTTKPSADRPQPSTGELPIAIPARPECSPDVKESSPSAGRLRLPAAVRRLATAVPQQAALALPEDGWVFPPVSLLTAAPKRSNDGPSQESLENNARLLESVLADYGVQGAIREIRPGPVVTLYELEPAPGIRSARVIGLADDVARSLSVTAVRIATVPGRNVIGIEVPNAKREMVFLSELLSTEAWTRNPGRLTLALGKDNTGAPIIADLARMPHLLIAGTTGSGKSVGVNAMILSLLYRLSPEQCRLILIDPKMLELSVYEGIPHLMAPVVTEPAKAVTALKWTVREMERRYRAMSQLSVRNIGGYNDRVASARATGEMVTRRVQTGFDSETGKPTFEDQPLALQALPFIVVVIDEMADLMMVAGKEIEAAVQRLAQMARAAGIHVIMATQRPSVDVITGTIKANFPTRISFQVISKFDSRTILGEQGAEQLLGQGDLLHMVGGGRIARVHGPFVTDHEVEEVVSFLRDQGEPSYVDDVTEPPDGEDGPALSSIADASDGEKGLFDQAVALVSREGKASTSFIQRHLSIGYNRAAKLIEQMEKEGIVTPANHVGRREVLTRRVNDD